MTIDTGELPISIDTGTLAKIQSSHYGDVDPTDPTVAYDEERDRLFKMHVDGANKVRRTLLEGNDFLDIAEVAELASGGRSDIPITQKLVHYVQERGSVLAVPDHGRLLFPTFQFHPRSMTPSPLVRYVHDELSDMEGEAADPWDVLSYWDQPRSTLGGQAFKNIIWNRGAKRQIKRDITHLTDTSGF